jgi:putative transposon-encoded protein
MVREIRIENQKKIVLKDDVLEVYDKIVTPYGNGAKIDCMKRHIGKRVLVVVLKD